MLLASGEVHKPGVALISEAELFEQAFAVYRFLLVKRSPEVYRLPYFDPLLQLRLLELNADTVLQLIDLTKRIETQNRDAAPVGRAQTFDALHRGSFSRAIWPDQTKYLAVVDLERHFVDSYRFAVGLADSRHLNDGTHDNLQNRRFTEPDRKFISWTCRIVGRGGWVTRTLRP